MLYSDNVPMKWTIGAFLCYKRNCNCKGCFIHDTFPETLAHKCGMKSAVKKLIETVGLHPDMENLMDAFLEEDDGKGKKNGKCTFGNAQC